MPGLVNLVFDNSARVAFEKRLIKEIADAASIPVKTISIEEVGFVFKQILFITEYCALCIP